MTPIEKLKRTYSLEAKTVKVIEEIARATRRDFSSVIDIAVEKLCREQFPELCTSNGNDPNH